MTGVMVRTAVVATALLVHPRLSVAVTMSVAGWPFVPVLKLTDVPYVPVIVPLVTDHCTLDQLIHELKGSGGSMYASSDRPAQTVSKCR
jgi:hypothetical protein